jgi:LysR family glycine cleavage system transcriptional activator
LFGPRLARFQEKHPEIEMRLNLTDLVPDSHWHGADVTIHCGAGRYEGGQAIKLTSESLSPVCSPSLIGKPSMSRATFSPSDLASLPLLHVEWFEPETTFRTLAWERWFAAAGVDTGGLELAGTHFSHTASSIQLAIAGKGVALASDCLAADAIASGLLVRPFDIRLKMSRDYYLVYNDSVADLAKVMAFRDWLVAETEQLRSA